MNLLISPTQILYLYCTALKQLYHKKIACVLVVQNFLFKKILLKVKVVGAQMHRSKTHSLNMIFWKCSDVLVFLGQRWIKELEIDSCSGSVEDGTESTSSQHSTSSRSTPNPLSTGTAIPRSELSHYATICNYTYVYFLCQD